MGKKNLRFRQSRIDGPENQPLGQLYITPLIDVLLVLLVMILLTMPLTTHSLEVPLPAGDAPFAVTQDNTVSITDGDALVWNGNAVTGDDLYRQLAATAKLKDAATVRFDPHANASYDRSARTIALIKDSGTENFAFVGNERYKEWDR